MRHCYNDKVEVFEESNTDLTALLHSVAEHAKTEKANSYLHLNVDYDTGDSEYRATLYVHD